MNQPDSRYGCSVDDHDDGYIEDDDEEEAATRWSEADGCGWANEAERLGGWDVCECARI